MCPTPLTGMSGQPRRTFRENHAQIPSIPFKKTDQNSGSLGSKPFWILCNWGGRFRKTDLGLGNHFHSASFEVLLLGVLEGRLWLVEAELLGQGDESRRTSDEAGRIHELEEWAWGGYGFGYVPNNGIWES